MANGEYRNLFVEPSMPDGDFPPKAPRVVFDSEAGFGDTTFGFRYSYFTGPPFQFEEPHIHDYDQFLCFLGTPENAREFDAEVEVSLGDEGEKYLVDKTTIVHIPAGLTHCPLNFKRVDKPVLLVNITLSPKYVKKTASKS
jgi:hypothetical protein